MKKLVLSALLLLSSLGSTQAANLYASNLGNGITLINGTTAFANGTVRFGVFPDGFDFAATAGNFDLLDAAFTEVVATSGAFTVDSVSGFYQVSETYDTSASYGGSSYADGIAGKTVYVWVLDNVVPADAVQSAIFATSQTWAEADALVPDTFVSPDSGAAGLVAHLGSLADGDDIGAGAPSHRASAALNAVVASRTPATTGIELGTAVTLSVAVEGGFDNSFQWRKNGEDIVGAESATYVIPSVTQDDFADYDVVVTSEDITLISNVVQVAPIRPLFIQQPASQIVAVGGTLNLSANVVGAGDLRLQWKKGANVAGATTPSISIPDVTLKSAGTYTLVAANTPGAGTATVTSDKVEVAVVDTTERTIAVSLGGTAKLAIAAAGKGITYQWFKDEVAVSGATKKTLSVKVTEAGLAGEYFCVVTGPGGSLPGGVQDVVLISEAPVFTGGPNITLPNSVVGSDYSVEVYPLMDQSPAKTPLSFKAAKLPPGLKMDTKTGIISGRPTKAGTYSATITAVTSKDLGGTVVATASITIADFPSGLAGTYVASVASDDVVGDGLGGRVDFTITTKGALSGKILLGGDKVVAFKGAVVIPSVGNPTLDIDIIRKTSYLPLNLSAEIDLTSGLLVDAELSQQGGSADLQGWKNTAAGAAFAGVTNFGLQIPVELEGDSDIPQGVSYGSINVKSPAGTLTIVGSTADGQKITGSTFVGPQGQVVLHNAYYVPFKGSLTGVLDLNRGATAADDTITGAVTWTRPANTIPKSKMYQAGFGPLELTPVGGRHEDTGVILGVSAGTAADLVFEEAGISETNNPSMDLTLEAKNKFTVVSNPENTKLKLVSKTGAFSGSFVQPTRRNAKFLGLAIRTSPTTVDGLGYFILPQEDGTTVLSGYTELSATPAE